MYFLTVRAINLVVNHYGEHTINLNYFSPYYLFGGVYI